MSPRGIFNKTHLLSLIIIIMKEGNRTPVGERERERESVCVMAREILFEEPNPTGSRPSDLIGLYEMVYSRGKCTQVAGHTRSRRPRPATKRHPLGLGL